MHQRTHPFTNEEIAMLAEAERKMDSGESQYVVYRGGRAAVPDETMDALGLVCGQTVNDVIWVRILETNIASLQARIALRDAGKKQPR